VSHVITAALPSSFQVLFIPSPRVAFATPPPDKVISKGAPVSATFHTHLQTRQQPSSRQLSFNQATRCSYREYRGPTHSDSSYASRLVNYNVEAAVPVNRGGTHPGIHGATIRASANRQSFLPVGLCVDESVPIVSALPRFSIPVPFEAGLGLGLGLCVELVLPMPSAVGSPPTPFVDGAAVSAASDNPLATRKRTKATAAVPMLRCITLSF
jgi:hypothetical protein